MFELAPWHRRQAAMLYHYSSLDYLKGLHQQVSFLIDGVIDPSLVLAHEQGRDRILADQRWGGRNTSENWANNAWPILKSLQASLARDIGLRAFEDFKITSLSSTLRGIDEFSMAWLTENEEERYRRATSAVCKYADPLDRTLDRQPTAGWNDFEFAAAFPEFASKVPRIPRFRVKTDMVVSTGDAPFRTGVYVSADDENAAVQFAWAGQKPCALRPAITFNEIGLDALASVGRTKLWLDKIAMLEFATQPRYRDIFEGFILIDDELDLELAPAAVAQESFMLKPGRWFLVEIVEEAAEDTAMLWPAGNVVAVGPRLEAGEQCQHAGYYFSPAQPYSRRRFELGERMPDLESFYGQTLWQWDTNQET